MAISSTQSITTRFRVVGEQSATTAYRRVAGGANAVAVANERMGASALGASRKMSFMENQMRFTGRRMLFYGTMVFAALGAAAIKMGFSYTNAIQTTRVALGPLFKDQQKLNDEIQKLYKIAVFSPFLFKDTVQAFRQMYIAMAPLGISADSLVDTIQAIVNGLAAAGKSTPQNLNRAAVALQHMAYQGRLTGRTVQQLAMDGLPVYDILSKKLGVTKDQMHDIASLNIAPGAFLTAFRQYMKETPGFENAAKRLSQGTLPGLFAQFQDILSQVLGKSTLGGFNFLENTLKRVNDAMAPLMTSKKPVGLMDVVKAIDSVLSPRTHLIINLFTTLSSAFWLVTRAIGALLFAIQQALRPFDYILNLFGGSTKASKLLGYWLGILGVLWIATSTKAIIAAIAVDLYQASLWGASRAARAATIASAVFQAVLFLIANPIRMAQLGISLLITYLSALRLILIPATGQMWAFTTALIANTAAALANPFVLLGVSILALTVGLVVLYFKWKKFHDFVDRTYKFLKAHPLAALFIPIYGQVIYSIVAIQKLYSWVKKLWNLLQHPFDLKINISKVGGGGWFGKFLKFATAANPATMAAKILTNPTEFRNYIPYGSYIPPIGGSPSAMSSGPVVAGGGGPDIITMPQGATVSPLQRAISPNAGAINLPKELNLKTVLRVDGKDLADVVSRHRLDRQARR